MDDVVEKGNLVVDANITNIQAKSSTYTWKDTRGKTNVTTYYTGVAEAMLTLKDAKTGEVIANPTVSGKGTTDSKFSTSDQAIRDALIRLSNQITRNRLPCRRWLCQREGCACWRERQRACIRNSCRNSSPP